MGIVDSVVGLLRDSNRTNEGRTALSGAPGGVGRRACLRPGGTRVSTSTYTVAPRKDFIGRSAWQWGEAAVLWYAGSPDFQPET
jgi:hypothetical protein